MTVVAPLPAPADDLPTAPPGPLAGPLAEMPLVIAYRPLTSLTPDPRNARTHPKRQLDQIEASIRASASPTRS